MQGIVFDFCEPYCDVSDTILTKTKFACKYKLEGWDYRVEAKSADGVKYQGNWGCPDPDENCTVELVRFESKTKEIVLLGTWRDLTDNQEGVYLFRLNQ